MNPTLIGNHELGDAHEASLYRALVKSLPEYAIFRIGTNGRIQSWNQGVERILGYTEGEFLELHLSQLFTPEDRQKGIPDCELHVAAETGRGSDSGWRLKKDGTRFFCDG